MDGKMKFENLGYCGLVGKRVAFLQMVKGQMI